MLSLLTASLTLLTITFLRLLYILPFTQRTPAPDPSKTPKHLMILLGSGGHTAEMLLLLADLKHTSQYLRTYICTSGDAFSVEKAHAFEAAQNFGGEYQITCIPRARYVRQSIFTTPWDVAKCAWGCVLAFFEPGNRLPDVLVMNGPGTAVVMTVVVLAAKFFGVAKTRTIYVESFARVKSLSLSGRILYPVVDRFLVQWPLLKEKYSRAEFKGVLV